MRTLSRAILATLAAVSLSAPAIGQTETHYDRGMAGLQLLSNPPIHEELKLDAQQVSGLSDYQAQARTRLAEEYRQIQANLKGNERRKAMEDVRTEVNEAAERFIKETLKPDQFNRFREIFYRGWGVRAFAFPEVLDKLQLSPEQATRVGALVDSYNTVLSGRR